MHCVELITIRCGNIDGFKMNSWKIKLYMVSIFDSSLLLTGSKVAYILNNSGWRAVVKEAIILFIFFLLAQSRLILRDCLEKPLRFSWQDF